MVPDLSVAPKQRQREDLLAALKSGPLSTVEAREQLGILHVSARVLELRRLGFPIQTTIRTRIDAWGRIHRCGVYVLECRGAP